MALLRWIVQRYQARQERQDYWMACERAAQREMNWYAQFHREE